MTVIGVVALVAALAGGALMGIATTAARALDEAQPVGNIDRLTIDVGRTDLTVGFADVDDASLEANQPGLTTGTWTFHQRGTELVVRSPGTRRPVSTWSAMHATLALPMGLAGTLDLRADIAAGTTSLEGDFDAMELEINAGRTTFTGSAGSLELDVNAGQAVMGADDVGAVRTNVQVGSLQATLTGTPPRSVSADVAVGSIELVVPQADYAVRESRIFGSSDEVAVRHDPASELVMDLSAQLGQISVSYS